jgi:hypothetical protein
MYDSAIPELHFAEPSLSNQPVTPRLQSRSGAQDFLERNPVHCELTMECFFIAQYPRQGIPHMHISPFHRQLRTRGMTDVNF